MGRVNFKIYPRNVAVIFQLLSLYDPRDCSAPGFPVSHHLLEFAQTHDDVNEVIQSSCPLWSPSPPALSPSQHQGLFNELTLCIRWPKDWSVNVSPSNEYSGLVSFRIDWLISLQSKGLSRDFPSITMTLSFKGWCSFILQFWDFVSPHHIYVCLDFIEFDLILLSNLSLSEPEDSLQQPSSETPLTSQVQKCTEAFSLRPVSLAVTAAEWKWANPRPALGSIVPCD